MTKKLVFGIGVNDANYVVQVDEIISHGGSGKRKRQAVWVCPFYRKWKHMLGRCYDRRVWDKQPEYIGCSVVPEWHTFSTFRRWMEQQPWEGNQLDKDILVENNKIYGPNVCVFIPQQLNLFLIDCRAARGAWPIGVNLHKRDGVFQASCSNPFTGRREYLGSFDCPDQAHSAWKKRKHELACQYAELQVDSRIAEALRTRYL